MLRDALIDCYGCMLAGSDQPVVQKTLQVLRATGRIGARGSAVIFGSGERAPPGDAAMINAIAGHALEFDDWEIPGNTHVSVLLMPAILAAAADRRLSGDEAANAYLAGFEAIARIGEAINFEHYRRGWHATATIGALGVAAAVSRLMGLDAATTAQALAIASSRALGFNAQFGSDAKPLQVGFAVEGGLLAAQLAAAGLSGQAGVFDHPNGMAALMSASGSQQIEAAMAAIGEQPAIDEHGIVFKPWPSCGYTHRIMTAMLELREQGIDTAEIRHIELSLPETHASILPFRHPSNRAEALFSLPYCAAMALLCGGMTLADLRAQSWRREDVRRLIDLTTVRPFESRRPQLNFDPEQPDRVRIRAHRQEFESRVVYPLGAPQNPLTANHQLDKLRDNARLGEAAASNLFTRLGGWPEADNIHELFVARPGEAGLS